MAEEITKKMIFNDPFGATSALAAADCFKDVLVYVAKLKTSEASTNYYEVWFKGPEETVERCFSIAYTAYLIYLKRQNKNMQ